MEGGFSGLSLPKTEDKYTGPLTKVIRQSPAHRLGASLKHKRVVGGNCPPDVFFRVKAGIRFVRNGIRPFNARACRVNGNLNVREPIFGRCAMSMPDIGFGGDTVAPADNLCRPFPVFFAMYPIALSIDGDQIIVPAAQPYGLSVFKR
jgi:hypothetical protein